MMPRKLDFLLLFNLVDRGRGLTSGLPRKKGSAAPSSPIEPGRGARKLDFDGLSSRQHCIFHRFSYTEFERGFGGNLNGLTGRRIPTLASFSFGLY